jgi:hypothetical protein
MPAVRAKGKSKNAISKAVAKNMQGLVAANKNRPADKQRSQQQLIAIAYSESKPKSKKKKK